MEAEIYISGIPLGLEDLRFRYPSQADLFRKHLLKNQLVEGFGSLRSATGNRPPARTQSLLRLNPQAPFKSQNNPIKIYEAKNASKTFKLVEGFEPPTRCLQNSRSTTELHQQLSET